MSEKVFKILSIDGGGIKGVYPALIIQHLEEEFGSPISDYFDMICGTSTGGLIALALSIKKPSSEIANIYLEKGSQIFPPPRFGAISIAYRSLKQAIWFGKYDNKRLRAILNDFFGESTMSDANNLLCVPSYNLTLGQPRIFKYPHREGNFSMDKNIKMSDAALATSAAPTYLPIMGIDEGLYVDGGLWCNNPSICGLIEALDYFVGPDKQFDSYKILSIPTIAQPTGWSMGIAKNRSFIRWRGKLMQASMDGHSYFIHYFMERMIKHTVAKGEYYRIPSPVLSAEQMKKIDMDKADKGALSLMKHIGNSAGAHYRRQPEVAAFFNNKKLYNTK